MGEVKGHKAEVCSYQIIWGEEKLALSKPEEQWIDLFPDGHFISFLSFLKFLGGQINDNEEPVPWDKPKDAAEDLYYKMSRSRIEERNPAWNYNESREREWEQEKIEWMIND